MCETVLNILKSRESGKVSALSRKGSIVGVAPGEHTLILDQ
jgi:hypothetical protein